MGTWTAITTATALSAAALVGAASPASAVTETRGTCSAGSTWEADLERDLGVYGIDFEVTTGAGGQRWRLTVEQNGTRVHGSTRTTRADDDRYADVDWEVLRPDRAGVRDRFALTAVNAVTGERCATTLRG